MSARYYLVSWSLLVIRLQGIRWVCFVCVISLHCHYIIPISVTWFRALECGRAHFAFGSWDETLMQFETRGSTDEANRRSRKRLLLADCEAIFNCTSALTIQIWLWSFRYGTIDPWPSSFEDKRFSISLGLNGSDGTPFRCVSACRNATIRL